MILLFLNFVESDIFIEGTCPNNILYMPHKKIKPNIKPQKCFRYKIFEKLKLNTNYR